jgi:mercuric ion binding protein
MNPLTRRAFALVLAVVLGAPHLAGAAERTVVLAIDNMYCSACPYIVRETLAAVPGVVGVEVSFEDKRATVTFEDNLASVDDLAKASAEAGYPAQPLP